MLSSNKRDKNKISIILTGYNEGDVLLSNLDRIYLFLEKTKYDWELILFDDKSMDKTLDIFKKFASSHNKVKVFKHDNNIGRGGTVIDALKVAKGNIVGYLDTDLELSPIFLPDFIDKILKGYDLVIGSRIYEMNTSNFLRTILSKGYTFLVKVLLNVSYKDTEAGFKFFRKSKIKKVVKKIKDKRWFFDTELVVRSEKMGLKIAETPVLYIRKIDKKSTVNLFRDSIGYFIRLIKLALELNS